MLACYQASIYPANIYIANTPIYIVRNIRRPELEIVAAEEVNKATGNRVSPQKKGAQPESCALEGMLRVGVRVNVLELTTCGHGHSLRLRLFGSAHIRLV